MFEDAQPFNGFTVNDLEQAKAFYSEVLGLEIFEDSGLLILRIDGSPDVVVTYDPHHAPSPHTILNFPVENIDAVVEELWRRGVQFEFFYDNQDDMGISRDGGGPNIAWFRDPAGNLLAVIEVG